MTALIQILDTQAANQIAAGEVVERPISVVKELIENALDAGAQQIEVTIEGSGVDFIRVRDDGRGISPEDLPRSILRHATSKIRSIEDLNDLRTLGFRGEALPSIASVSKMEIITRTKDEISGMLLRLEGGEQVDFKEIGCPPGTTVTVEDLFFNTPARRKFLKSTNTEFGLISDVIGRLSLAHPEVAFTLKHPKVVVLQTSGRGRLLESIAAILGQTTARRVLPVSFSKKEWSLEGYISPPDLVRSTRQGETLFVNGRIIRSPLISRAIAEGYHTLIPHKLYPISILSLQLPPHEYDVNVHPTKMEIRFHQEKELAEFISESIREVLLQAHPVTPFEKNYTSFAFQENNSVVKPSVKPDGKPAQYSLKFSSSSQPPRVNSSQVTTHSSENSTNSVPFPMNLGSSSNLNSSSTDSKLTEIVPEPSVANTIFTVKESIPISNLRTTDHFTLPEPFDFQKQFLAEPVIPSQELEEFISNDAEIENPLLALRPLGQIFNTYILSTDGEHLVIFDQHAAHERINYERLLQKHRANPGDSQALLIPIPLEFTAPEEQALLEHLMLLNDMGFILEQFGTRTYLLRGIPAYSGHYQGERLLRDFLDQVLLKQIPPTFDQLLEEWIYMLACKESIKAKESLSLLEMEQLIVQLSKTDNPYTCPHGRPTMVKLTRGELERRFYRS